MRIIGGISKGRRLASFRGLSIRPTGDRVREAVFNILQRDLYGKVLDLFAGTGAMGLEALSRGATEAVFVDASKEAYNIINKNLDLCGLKGKARVYRADVLGSIRALSRRSEKFDVIFIDPPYEASLLEKTLEGIMREGLLGEEGVVVAEASKRRPLESVPPGLELYDERRYGDTLVYFLRAGAKEK